MGLKDAKLLTLREIEGATMSHDGYLKYLIRLRQQALAQTPQDEYPHVVDDAAVYSWRRDKCRCNKIRENRLAHLRGYLSR